jgi:hypothetical protein
MNMKIKCPECKEVKDYPLLSPDFYKYMEFKCCNKRFAVKLDIEKGKGYIYELKTKKRIKESE